MPGTATDPAVRNRAAVLGSPVAHSLSPVLHRAAYDWLRLRWDYEAIEMTPEGLPEFVRSLDESWAGLSLTMPLKETVLPLLDRIDPVAERIRSVNTVVLDGPLRKGFNTDVFGILQALREAHGGLGRPAHGIVVGS